MIDLVGVRQLPCQKYLNIVDWLWTGIILFVILLGISLLIIPRELQFYSIFFLRIIFLHRHKCKSEMSERKYEWMQT